MTHKETPSSETSLTRGRLPEFHTIDGMDEMEEWLKKSSLRNVAYWVDQIMRGNMWAAPPLLRPCEDEEVLFSWSHSENPRFKQIISLGVDEVRKAARWDIAHTQNFDYFAAILTSIGYLRVETSRDFVTELAEKEMLKPVKNINGASLHRFVLASLGAFPADERMAEIYRRDIYEIEFSGLCYRLLWKYKPEYALQYADLMREMGARDPKTFPLRALLNEASNKLGIDLGE